MSRCDVYLENYSDCYSSGDTIIGHVLCTFTTPKKVHGIAIRIRGIASTEWEETLQHYDYRSKRTVIRLIPYYGSHSLLDTKIDVLPGADSGILPKGVYKYPFKFMLPPNLPSSFREKYGQINYTIKAVVKCPMLEFNYKAQSPFIVVTPVDLNMNPKLKNPITKTYQKETYFLLWNKGNINVKASIPRSGLTNQEPLPLHISVENMSQSNIGHITCNINKTITFTTTTPSKRVEQIKEVVFKDQYNGVGANGFNTYDKMIILKNASLISNYIDCDVIKVTYDLEITCVIAGMHTNIVLEMPVTLGHVPFSPTLGMGPPPPYNIGFYPILGQSGMPPSYSFDHQQPLYNPDVMPTKPAPPPYHEFGKYSQASAPSAPTLESSIRSKTDKHDDDDDEWEFIGFV